MRYMLQQNCKRTKRGSKKNQKRNKRIKGIGTSFKLQDMRILYCDICEKEIGEERDKGKAP